MLFPESPIVNKKFTTAYWLKEERELSLSARIITHKEQRLDNRLLILAPIPKPVWKLYNSLYPITGAKIEISEEVGSELSGRDETNLALETCVERDGCYNLMLIYSSRFLLYISRQQYNMNI